MPCLTIHFSYFNCTSCSNIYSIYPSFFFFLDSSLSDDRMLFLSPLKPLSPAWPLIFYLYPSIGLSSPQLNALTQTQTHTCRQLNRALTHSYQAFQFSVNCHIVISRIVMGFFLVSSLMALDVTHCGIAHLICQKRNDILITRPNPFLTWTALDICTSVMQVEFSSWR